MGAPAYTVGSDVVFVAGRYGPGTAAGDRLLAHELVHTLEGDVTTLRRQPLSAAWDAFAQEAVNATRMRVAVRRAVRPSSHKLSL